MAQLNLVLPSLTDAETTTIRSHFESIKAILQQKFINLTPDDRRIYGSINQQNKLLVNRVKDFNDNQPELSSPKVDWVRYVQHSTTPSNYEKIVDLADEITELCNDPRTLVDYTLYGMARQDYRFTKFNAEDDGGEAPGFEAKYNDLKEFFEHDDAAPPAQFPGS